MKSANAVHRWVPGSNSSGPYHRPTYDLKKSPVASIVPNVTFMEIYPGTHASGMVVRDTVAFPGTSAVVKKFTFGVASNLSAALLVEPFDGFLGMGFAQRRREFSNSSEEKDPLNYIQVPHSSHSQRSFNRWCRNWNPRSSP